ncbi:activin receptor type-2B-like [Exaiptasia diaphana]|uniref:Activin types I and II receptor domain-containing protein n=1 Tax=Exaiptasia diaphana TaxID=2652724 RepID=A0A913YHX6_EXADI|nr:activin receptor type-2B-like [Exaiptasia diaphana]
MNLHVCKLAVILVALLTKSESKLLSSNICEVYDPYCKPPNCPTHKRCPVKPYRLSHCFAVLSSTPVGEKVIRKGCWLQNLQLCPLSKQCKTRKTSRDSVRFCCCTGNNCNSKVN